MQQAVPTVLAADAGMIGGIVRHLAVLVAAHNRREQTLAALDAVETSARVAGVSFRVFLTDDGSTDGTQGAVAERFPTAVVIQGTGSLFWAAAMRLAEDHASLEPADYFLWLNDDTVMDSDALRVMLSCSDGNPRAIIVAALRDPQSGEVTYGGRKRLGAHPQRFALLGESSRPQFADTFNGNLVLVPRVCHADVGPIDGSFPHAYADDDYGLRATSKGIPIIQPPGTLGVCARNPVSAPPSSLRERWALIQSPKGTPFAAQARYLRRHGPWWWPVILFGGHIRKLFVPR